MAGKNQLEKTKGFKLEAGAISELLRPRRFPICAEVVENRDRFGRDHIKIETRPPLIHLCNNDGINVIPSFYPHLRMPLRDHTYEQENVTNLPGWRYRHEPGKILFFENMITTRKFTHIPSASAEHISAFVMAIDGTSKMDGKVVDDDIFGVWEESKDHSNLTLFLWRYDLIAYTFTEYKIRARIPNYRHMNIFKTQLYQNLLYFTVFETESGFYNRYYALYMVLNIPNIISVQKEESDGDTTVTQDPENNFTMTHTKHRSGSRFIQWRDTVCHPRDPFTWAVSLGIQRDYDRAIAPIIEYAIVGWLSRDIAREVAGILIRDILPPP